MSPSSTVGNMGVLYGYSRYFTASHLLVLLTGRIFSASEQVVNLASGLNVCWTMAGVTERSMCEEGTKLSPAP